MDFVKTLEIEKVARLTGEYNGKKFWFDAKVNIVTPAFLSAMAALESDSEKFAQGVSEVITDWEDETENFPPTYENLRILPVEFLVYLVGKAGEHVSGNESKPKPSRNGSAASAK